MATRFMSVDEFIAFMRKQQGERNAKEFADSMGVTPQYLCDIYNGRRVPGKSIAAALGVTRKTVYTISPKEGQE